MLSVPAIPLLGTGKTDYVRLKQMAEAPAAAAQSAGAAPTTPVSSVL